MCCAGTRRRRFGRPVMQARAETLVRGEADEHANCIVREPTVLWWSSMLIVRLHLIRHDLLADWLR